MSDIQHPLAARFREAITHYNQHYQAFGGITPAIMNEEYLVSELCAAVPVPSREAIERIAVKHNFQPNSSPGCSAVHVGDSCARSLADDLLALLMPTERVTWCKCMDATTRVTMENQGGFTQLRPHQVKACPACGTKRPEEAA